MRIIVRRIKTKTRAIDMKKGTLAYVWYERVWRAYNTQFSRAYDMKFVAVHMICIYPTTLILPIALHTHAKANFFVSIPHVFIFIWRTIYTHFHEIVLDLDIIGYNCFQF